MRSAGAGPRTTTTSVISRSRVAGSSGKAWSSSWFARLDSVSRVISTSVVSTSPRNMPMAAIDATTATSQTAITRQGRRLQARASRSVIAS